MTGGPTLRPRKTFYADIGLSEAPECADRMGWIHYREGFESLPPAQWTEAERFLKQLADEVAALEKGKKKP